MTTTATANCQCRHHDHRHARVYAHGGLKGGGGGVSDKFMKVNIVCFDVDCFVLIVKYTRLRLT